ncbi:hypothetical protein TSMEX_006411 [Taenia solium]|eukprot:TsM_000601500 transcript=TsM_000601500 gene=TsM_000601500
MSSAFNARAQNTFTLDTLSEPFFMWTFDGNTGGWVNDVSNYHQKWELINGAICLHNVPADVKLSSDGVPWFSANSRKEDKKTKNLKALLWSPPIPQTVGMRCVTIDYNMSFNNVKSESHSLTLLQQQDGHSSETVLCIFPRSHILPRPSMKTQADAPAKPFFVWTFNENTGKWTNDAANQRQKWELMGGAICLHNMPAEIEGSSDDMSWLSLADEREEKGTNSAKALFWSPLIPHVVGMRCIAMDYRINAGLEVFEKYSLAILHQQDGRHFSNVLAVSILPPPVDSLPKPYYVWTFNENTGRWVNDPANWNQKWELIDGAICLHNAPIEPKTSSDDMPWLSVESKKNDKAVRSSKSPLWSPPISEAAGMRCIKMNYLIYVGSIVSGSFELAMLLQHDGFCQLFSGSLLSSKSFSIFARDPLPKPYFVWTFDEDAGSWVNDAANWNQKWELISGAICLFNVPVELKKHSKNTLAFLDI